MSKFKVGQIKHQVICQIIDKGSMKRSDVVDLVLQLNGKTTKYKSSYYSTNFTAWAADGLIKMEDGVFTPGENAKLYAFENQKYQIKMLRKQRDAYKAQRDHWWSHRADEQFSSQKDLNSLISKLAKAFNDSKVLYADMVWQEELFDMQARVIDALYEAHLAGLLSTKQMLMFEYVFSVEKNKASGKV